MLALRESKACASKEGGDYSIPRTSYQFAATALPSLSNLASRRDAGRRVRLGAMNRISGRAELNFASN